jgi:Plasmid pRiA4b ORF-3-like protein
MVAGTKSPVRRLKLPSEILQLHIELTEVRPRVWRRILVPETITLGKLHRVIQAAFGWGDMHLHEFVARDGQRYGTSDPMYDAPGEVASERTKLMTALAGARTMDYLYDFGDSWDHRIKVERTYAPDPQIKLPWCIDGAGATPPEDCGGAPGYEDFVQAMTDPTHPEHEDMVQWIGLRTWDTNRFDTAEVNTALALQRS